MKTYRYTVGELPNIILPLGIQGENETREIRIDFTEWLTDAEGYPMIKVLMPNGEEYWAITNREDEEDPENGSRSVIVWPITSVDTTEYGDGLIRLVLFGANSEILKSQPCRTQLAPAFIKYVGDAPDYWKEWMDALGEKAAIVSASALSAMKDAATASEAAELSEACALAIKESRPETLAGLMNLATTMNVSIALDDWETVTGGWSVTRERSIITSETAATLVLDEVSAGRCEACIEMDTSAGTVTFFTSTKPTGALSGILILQGRFAADVSGDLMTITGDTNGIIINKAVSA